MILNYMSKYSNSYYSNILSSNSLYLKSHLTLDSCDYMAMGRHLPVDYIARTREQYARLGYDEYRWAERPGVPPFIPLGKKVNECNVALVASGGAYLEGQVAFHWKDDTGVRLIDSTLPASDVRVTHFAYDLEPARSDPNIVFPVDRLRELVDDGILGSLAPQAVACMGGIYSERRTEQDLAPAIVRAIQEMDGPPVDLVLLVPV